MAARKKGFAKEEEEKKLRNMVYRK